MLKTLLVLLASLALATPALAAEPPVQVMVLGAYHFGNPGLDVNNVKIESVLTPERQRQLEAVAQALLTFRPTRVMVERESSAPDLAVADYAAFTPARLLTDANEISQIGYRVASLAKLPLVSGIDEQPAAGEPDYFPYDQMQAAAQKFGQQALIDEPQAVLRTQLARFEADQKTASIARLLLRVNTDPIYTRMDDYYTWLRIGDHDNQAGADLNAMWYLRNAKIWGKLLSVARPGDRVLVIFGAGHGYWLRHFASATPGVVAVDPVPLLRQAAARSR
ncbi:hypothetical protein AQZ52_08415 [Novosphingobium fuchskuhlense]|uniref:TraB/GumN family protein n=1 Tax=Novosphingobium fuchskuhlense TaxID=1117702 RepID=A0A124JUV1_9SPHN|nr:DUF5694 domain-containing protein [Novosphingobium fuchskuhlense]KUR71629.1 hypothetical protein AQZ52_08415 [Novosphingobium fuchskuhlense]